MGKLKLFITGALLGGAGMYFSLQYHVLQAEEGFLVVPRAPRQRMQDAYADVREWDAATWVARPRLALAVTEHGRGDLMPAGVSSNGRATPPQSIKSVQEQLQKISGGWEPATTTSTPPREPSPGATARGADPVPQQTPPARRGYLPLADLFGIGGETSSPSNVSPLIPPGSSATVILPAGSKTSNEVELLPSPAEFEMLDGPGDVRLGPSAPLPGSNRAADRRRTEARGGWEPLTVQPF